MPVLEDPTVCMMEGFINSSAFVDVDFNVLVAKYNAEFTQLPIPVVKINGDKIEIIADDAVSIVSLDNEYEIDYEAKFDFDRTKPHVIRLLTVKGRSVIGLIEAGGQQWEWLQ